tara:strand:- start:347 stop:541 length:195 start_codon:yes stop_codon:yes gene_type:complete
MIGKQALSFESSPPVLPEYMILVTRPFITVKVASQYRGFERPLNNAALPNVCPIPDIFELPTAL